MYYVVLTDTVEMEIKTKKNLYLSLNVLRNWVTANITLMNSYEAARRAHPSAQKQSPEILSFFFD